VHARVEILRRVPDRSAVGMITRLADIGAIVTPAWGYYAKAGVDISSFDRPERDPERLGPAMRRMLDELDRPRSAIELKAILGGSRQAIEQKLKKLMAMKLIKRIDALGERGRHVYLKAEERADHLLVDRAPVLREPAARLLSMVPADAPTRLIDMIGTDAHAQRKHIVSLIGLGLLEWSGTRNQRVIRLTNSGREHPQYDAEAPKSRPLREALIPTEALQLLLGIHALGEARSIDLTLALSLGRGRKNKGTGTGQHIQRLEQNGLIEATGSKKGRHPSYRLTPAGLSHAATIRGEIEFPDPEVLKERLVAQRARYLDEQRKRGLAGLPAQNGRLLSILAALKDHGPLETNDINVRLPDPYGDPRSINLAMRTLLDRGKVAILRKHSTRRPTLWGLPEEKNAGGAGEVAEEPH
jgi:DNA-binding MarR family transcriptional regulator